MKKTALLLLALLMVLSLAACKNSESTEADGTYVSAFDLGDINDYVELGEYIGIEVEAQDMTVTDDDVEDELQYELASMSTYEQVTEGMVADGDVANIDFEGRMDGELFDGGSAEGYDLTIGSGMFIDGFEDGLIGAEIGSEVVLELTFPEDYSSTNPELNGAPVEFTVTINYVQGDLIEAELDDDFVIAYTDGEYTTLEEYRTYVRECLEEEKTDEAMDTMVNDAWDIICDNATFKKEATELIAYVYDSQMESFVAAVEGYGLTLDEYLEYIGSTEEELESELQLYAQTNAKTQLLVRAVIETEGLDLTDDEYAAGLEILAEGTGYDVDTLTSYYPEQMLKDILREDKVVQFVEDTMVITG